MSSRPRIYTVWGHAGATPERWQRCPPGPAEVCNMSSRPRIYMVWGHGGATPERWQKFPPGPAEVCSMSSRPRIYTVWGHAGATPERWQRCPPGSAEVCNMSSRPRIYRVWGHRGAEPTLCFIILKDKVGNDTSAETHWPRARCWPYPRILSRFRCKVGLQSGGTWFSSSTEQCPR